MAAITRTLARHRTLEVRATRDGEVLREFLEQDRLFAAYAICDLDEREFARTRWGIAMHGGSLIALVMEYSGESPQPVFAMGENDGIEAILDEVIRTRTAYVSARRDSLAAVASHYRVEPGPEMVRMVVDASTFVPMAGAVSRLLPHEIGELRRLYDLGLASSLPVDVLVHGVYYGVRVDGRLVAAAGTHVISRVARLAVVGNVLTHRDHRGRGYAKLSTAAVTAELLRTSDHVVLNVRSDNPPALAAYAAIGYREYTRFEERVVHRRGAVWDSIVMPFRRFLPPQRSPE